jgi:hypothetical protein
VAARIAGGNDLELATAGKPDGYSGWRQTWHSRQTQNL